MRAVAVQRRQKRSQGAPLREGPAAMIIVAWNVAASIPGRPPRKGPPCSKRSNEGDIGSPPHRVKRCGAAFSPCHASAIKASRSFSLTRRPRKLEARHRPVGSQSFRCAPVIRPRQLPRVSLLIRSLGGETRFRGACGVAFACSGMHLLPHRWTCLRASARKRFEPATLPQRRGHMKE